MSTLFHRIALATTVVVGTAVAPLAHAAVVGQIGAPITFTTNGDNLHTASFSSAQTGSLYIAMTVSLDAGVLNANDFLSVWFDNVTTGAHTNRPNIGLKSNEGTPGARDWMVRGSGTSGSYAPDQASVGTTTTLWAHLFKSSLAGNYDRFDLWVNPNGDWSDVLATAPEARSTLDSGLSSISGFGFRAANLDSGDRFTVQSLTISNAVPVSVVPEPGCR